jgi:hypothetical protein
MLPEDRQHGLEVLSILDGPANDPTLRQAALLHDVGKANAGIRLEHRVLRVLLSRRAPRLWSWLAGEPTGWRRPFWVVTNHPERGAVWVESVGGGHDLAALIRFHESDPPAEWASSRLGRLHATLADADAQC